MEIKHGIKELTPALILAIKSGESIYTVFKDGFQPFQDLLALLSTGTQIQAMLKDKKAIVDQFFDIDTDEAKELNKVISTEFGWTSEKTARRIKGGFNLIFAIIYFADELNEPGDATSETAGKK